MTASDTLRAALEKHGCVFNENALALPAILEAMEQHRAEALEEVEVYVKHLGQLHFKMGHKVAFAVRRKIAALKSLRGSWE